MRTDVAAALIAARRMPVELDAVPRDRWEAVFRGLGFSAAAALAYPRMSAVSVDGIQRPARSSGEVSLPDYTGPLGAGGQTG